MTFIKPEKILISDRASEAITRFASFPQPQGLVIGLVSISSLSTGVTPIRTTNPLKEIIFCWYDPDQIPTGVVRLINGRNVVLAVDTDGIESPTLDYISGRFVVVQSTS